MKKTLTIILVLFIITISLLFACIKKEENMQREVYRQNLEYEYYIDKSIYGTEVATIIDRAVEQNEKNKIKKDEKGHYIENDTDSIKIYIKMLITDKTYPMEEMYENQISQFVKYYNLVEFKCTSIEYHQKTGRISKMFFEEQEF